MDNYLRKLKENKLKITPRRKAVIELFARCRTLLTPYDVHNSLKRKITPLGLPTVYRILDELCEIGVITRMQTEDGRLCYAFCVSHKEHVHYFLCRKCNKAQEIAYCNFEGISRHIEKQLNAKVEAHQLQIEGLCSKCK